MKSLTTKIDDEECRQPTKNSSSSTGLTDQQISSQKYWMLKQTFVEHIE